MAFTQFQQLKTSLLHLLATEVSADFAGDLLIVQAPETVKSVVVFAADGTRVAEGRNAQLTVNAPAGVYLVKVNNFKVVKAMKN